jgi:hypothetical protein
VWSGEAFYGLGILLGALFLPSVAQESQQDFGVMELMLSGFAP